MNYEMIFYHAGKTAEIQELIDSSLSGYSLRLGNVSAAADAKELSAQLAASVSRSRLILVIGEEGSDRILSRVLTSSSESIREELIEGSGVRAVMRTVPGHAVIQLPGDTEDLSCIIDELTARIQEFFGLRPEKNDNISPIEAIKELDKKMASINRIKVTPSGSTAEKRRGGRLRALKITIAILLILAAAQLGAAAYLYITQVM